MDLSLVSSNEGMPDGFLPKPTFEFSLRQATGADVPAVIDIIRSLNILRSNASDSGFLRLRHEEADYHRYVENGHISLALLENQPVGFMVSFPWQSPELDSERKSTGAIKWTGENFSNGSDPLFNDMRYIGEVGIAPQWIRRGIGKSLYQQLFAENPGANVLAAIIEKPIPNSASAAFHVAMGFVRVGEFQLAEFYGLSPYQSGIYLRKGSVQ